MLDSDEALDDALAQLLRIDPALEPLRAVAGRPPLRKRQPGFEGLAMIVVSQQVSVASAAAIWKRVRARFEPMEPATILAATEDDLRACGLSAPKIRTMRAVAQAIHSGEVPLADLPGLPADEAHAHLVTMKGIGPWTADIYLLFCIGHPDAFPAGDLALQEAVKLGFGLDERPSAKALAEFAERWRPWRGAAAKLLWAYYSAMKRGADATPLAVDRNIMNRAIRTKRTDYRHFLAIPTRWSDNDAYAHVNNVVYYSWFDTVVNRWLRRERPPRHRRQPGRQPRRRDWLQLFRERGLPRYGPCRTGRRAAGIEFHRLCDRHFSRRFGRCRRAGPVRPRDGGPGYPAARADPRTHGLCPPRRAAGLGALPRRPTGRP